MTANDAAPDDIPEEAVRAALAAYGMERYITDGIRAALKAAAPFLAGTGTDPRCWDCGSPFRGGDGCGDNFCSEACADAYKRELGA